MGIRFKRVENKPEKVVFKVQGTRGLLNKREEELGTLTLHSNLGSLTGYPGVKSGMSEQFRTRSFKGEDRPTGKGNPRLTEKQRKAFKNYAPLGSRKRVHDELSAAFERKLGAKPGLFSRLKARWLLRRASRKFALAEFKER